MLSGPLGLHQPRCHRHIVENAKTTAFVGVGVVRAARQIRRHTLRQRPAGCADGRAHGAPRPLDHALGPGEADFALLRRAEPALSDGFYISGAVGQGQLAVRGGFCQIQRQIW